MFTQNGMTTHHSFVPEFLPGFQLPAVSCKKKKRHLAAVASGLLTDSAADIVGITLTSFTEVADVLKLDTKQLETWISERKIRASTFIRGNKAPTSSSETVPQIYLDLVEVMLVAKSFTRPTNVRISDIQRRDDCQVRDGLRQALVQEYRVHFAPGAAGMHPVTIVRVNGELWVIDGFHRLAAAEAEGRTEIDAHIFHGNQRSAIQAARRLNGFNGLRLTAAEIHRMMVKTVDENPALKAALVDGSVPLPRPRPTCENRR